MTELWPWDCAVLRFLHVLHINWTQQAKWHGETAKGREILQVSLHVNFNTSFRRLATKNHLLMQILSTRLPYVSAEDLFKKKNVLNSFLTSAFPFSLTSSKVTEYESLYSINAWFRAEQLQLTASLASVACTLCAHSPAPDKRAKPWSLERCRVFLRKDLSLFKQFTWCFMVLLEENYSKWHSEWAVWTHKPLLIKTAIIFQDRDNKISYISQSLITVWPQ